MSSNNTSRDNNNNNNNELSNAEDEESSEEEEEVEEWSDADRELFAAMEYSGAGFARMRQAVRNGAKVNRVHFGWTILMLACDCGADEAIRLFLDAGADARFMHSDGKNSPMMAAIRCVSSMEALLNHDKDLLEIASDKYGGTPLQVAIKQHDFDAASFLLDRGANALVTDKDGLTTLLLACQSLRSVALVRRLVAAGVPVEARDMKEHTALHHAAMNCSIEILRGFDCRTQRQHVGSGQRWRNAL